jgi:hypothetical protein
MPILNFPHGFEKASGAWRGSELRYLLTACATHVASGAASGWAFGETERGDPQLYLLGPDPAHDCVLSISRLDDLYVLEDGEGRIIFEHTDLLSLGEQIVAALRSVKPAMWAPVVIGWNTLRAFYEEEIEPALAESVEVLAHLGPGVAGTG